jgi:hypothetical protein
MLDRSQRGEVQRAAGNAECRRPPRSAQVNVDTVKGEVRSPIGHERGVGLHLPRKQIALSFLEPAAPAPGEASACRTSERLCAKVEIYTNYVPAIYSISASPRKVGHGCFL